MGNSKLCKSTGSLLISYKWVGKSQRILDEPCHCRTSSQSSLPPPTTLLIMVRIQTLWWRYSNELFNCLSCRLMAIKPLPNCNSFRPTPISYNPQSNTFPSFHFLYTLPPNPPGFLLTICVRLWGVRWAGGWMWVSPSEGWAMFTFFNDAMF